MMLPRRLISVVGLAAVVWLAWGEPGFGEVSVSVEQLAKARVIVLTDISNEPDDEESMVRFLAYSNEYDVEGLIATTSCWLRDAVRPERIVERVRAFGLVRDNLQMHVQGYPTAEELLGVVKAGRPEFGMAGVGEGKSSEGSEHIIKVVDEADERPVWVTVWGGANCLAQALSDVKNTRSEAEVKAFVDKLRVYAISDQDDAGPWIRHTFAGIFYIVTPCAVGSHEYYRATWTGISGDRFYKNGPMYKFELVDNRWLEENIIMNTGPLGRFYPRLEYIMEGDTPSFLGLISNGLCWRKSPAYGGWGGRYALYQTYGEAAPIWTNIDTARDTIRLESGMVTTTAQATIWRWREAYQYDFAARMDYCTLPYHRANHNPVAAVEGDKSKGLVNVTADVNDVVRLDASHSSDPDGNVLKFKWFVYPEAGSYSGTVELATPNSGRTYFKAPRVEKAETIHIILEVRDSGVPPLYSYRRIVVTVRPQEGS